MIVANHSSKAIDLLLPELELGLFDESWRIRQSYVHSFIVFFLSNSNLLSSSAFRSVQLVGDLLFRLSGVTGKPDEDDEGDEDEEGDCRNRYIRRMQKLDEHILTSMESDPEVEFERWKRGRRGKG